MFFLYIFELYMKVLKFSFIHSFMYIQYMYVCTYMHLCMYAFMYF